VRCPVVGRQPARRITRGTGPVEGGGGVSDAGRGTRHEREDGAGSGARKGGTADRGVSGVVIAAVTINSSAIWPETQWASF